MAPAAIVARPVHWPLAGDEHPFTPLTTSLETWNAEMRLERDAPKPTYMGLVPRHAATHLPARRGPAPPRPGGDASRDGERALAVRHMQAK
jgi:hypothetical protein